MVLMDKQEKKDRLFCLFLHACYCLESITELSLEQT